MLTRVRGAGVVIAVASGFLGREWLSWALQKVFDAGLATVKAGVSFSSVSWQNVVGMLGLVIGLAMVLWPSSAARVPKRKPFDELPSLAGGARNIIDRIRHHRTAKWHLWDRLEPLEDICRDGLALLMSFEKVGCIVPSPDTDSAEKYAISLEAYFSGISPLLMRGHLEEAVLNSGAFAAAAEQKAISFNPEQWRCI